MALARAGWPFDYYHCASRERTVQLSVHIRANRCYDVASQKRRVEPLSILEDRANRIAEVRRTSADLIRSDLFNVDSRIGPISRKAWNKLQVAERESGIALPLHEQLASTPDSQKKELLASASVEEILNLLPPNARLDVAKWLLDAQLEGTELKFTGFFLDVQELADLAKSKRSKSELKFFAERVGQSIQSCRDLVFGLVTQLRTALDLDTRSLADRVRDSSKPQAANASSAPHPEKPSKKKR